MLWLSWLSQLCADEGHSPRRSVPRELREQELRRVRNVPSVSTTPRPIPHPHPHPPMAWPPCCSFIMVPNMVTDALIEAAAPFRSKSRCASWGGGVLACLDLVVHACAVVAVPWLL